LASEAGNSIEAKNAITLTVAQTDGVKKIAAPAPAVKKPVTQMEPDEEVSEPVKRATKKVEVPPAGKKSLGDVINAWSAVD